MTTKIALLAATAILCSAPASATLYTHRAHGPINQTIDFSETSTTFASHTDFIDLPKASFNLIVPSGADQLAMAQFTVQVGIAGEDTGCWVR